MGTKPFAERVKAVRKALNLSQEDLAHILGISFASVNRWENGKTNPSKLAKRQFDQFYKDKKEQIDAWVEAGGAATGTEEQSNQAGAKQ